MDFSKFKVSSERVLDNAKAVVYGITKQHTLDVAMFSGQEGFDRVMKWIEQRSNKKGKPYSKGTIKSYVSAMSGILSQCDADVRPYRAKINELSTPKVESTKLSILEDDENEKASEVLYDMMKNTKLLVGVRLMAGLIYYGIDEQIQLQHLGRTRCDANNYTDHYLDLVQKCWHINSNHMSVKIPIMDKYIELIKSIGGPVWICGSYSESTSAFSTGFSKVTAIPFTNLRKQYVAIDFDQMTEDEIIEECSCYDVDVVDGNVDPVPQVQVPQVQVPQKIKVTVKKVVLKCEAPQNGVPWESLTDKEVREDTNELHENNVRRLQLTFCTKDDMFYPDLFSSQDGYERVIEHLTTYQYSPGKTYALNTQISYLASLSKYLEECNIGASIYAKYGKYRKKLEAEQDIAKQHRTVVDFETLIPKFYQILSNPTINKNVRVFALMIMCSVDESVTMIGVLRLSDLINTKFVDDGITSYVDIVKKQWLIREDKTKNKQERTLNLSTMFITGLLTIYDGKVPHALVFKSENKGGEPYTQPNSFSDMIQTHVGYRPSYLRASYVGYAHARWSVDVCKRIAYNSGHDYNTAIDDYLREND
jgi:hypothetical protein